MGWTCHPGACKGHSNGERGRLTPLRSGEAAGRSVEPSSSCDSTLRRHLSRLVARLDVDAVRLVDQVRSQLSMCRQAAE